MSQESRQVRFGYAEQSVFATAEADGGAVDEVTCDPFTMDPDVMIHELSVAHGTRQPVEQSTVHSVQGSSAKFSVNGPVDLNDIDQYMYAHFQKVVEAGDTEFTKTYTAFSSHPDFSADAGHFLTWIRRNPSASTSQKAKGCIAPRFKIAGERDAMLVFETDWVSYGSTEDESDPSGTWTPRDGTGFVYFNDIVSATLSHGVALGSPTALTMQSFEIESVFEVEKVGQDSTNGFEQHGIHTLSGSFKVKMLRDSTADEAIASMKVGELIELDIDAGLITINVTGKIESLEYDSDGLLINEITCRMLSKYTAGSWSDSLNIVVSNSIDRSWPAA